MSYIENMQSIYENAN